METGKAERRNKNGTENHTSGAGVCTEVQEWPGIRRWLYTAADCTNEKQGGSKEIVTYKLHGSLFSVEFWLLSLVPFQFELRLLWPPVIEDS